MVWIAAFLASLLAFHPPITITDYCKHTLSTTHHHSTTTTTTTMLSYFTAGALALAAVVKAQSTAEPIQVALVEAQFNASGLNSQ